MMLRHALLAGLLALALPATFASAQAPVSPRRHVTIDGRPDTSSYWLPDTLVLARVDTTRMRVSDFVTTWFNAYVPDRPEADSLGRVDWLNSMVKKVVLARVARRDTRPLGYEERLTMREFIDRTLSNVLYQRIVLDSIDVTEPEMRAFYTSLGEEPHLRDIVTADRGTAERARAELMAKKVDWKQAFDRYSIDQDRGSNGDLGWVSRLAMAPENADVLMPLKPGQYSPVFPDIAGYHVMQCVERRKATPPPYGGLKTAIGAWLRNYELRQRVGRLQARLRSEIGLRYDSTNVAFAAAKFRPTKSTTLNDQGAATISYNTMVPSFAAADTGRVLARWKDGQLTIFRFMVEYREIATFKRPSVNTPDTFEDQIDSIVLEPYRAALARSMGLEKDPMAVAAIDKRYEQFLVERMYRDSVEAGIQITPKERRAYYDQHQAGFITYAAATYAMIASDSAAGADSIVARLKRGEKAHEILRADSLRTGHRVGRIYVERESEHTAYHEILFEELKPGQIKIVGPDRTGRYGVMQLLSFDSGHQLSYEEAQGMADDNLRAIASEERLNKLYERHARGLKIVTRPELVMHVMLVDPRMLQD